MILQTQLKNERTVSQYFRRGNAARRRAISGFAQISFQSTSRRGGSGDFFWEDVATECGEAATNQRFPTEPP